jgi:hypothetical protein
VQDPRPKLRNTVATYPWPSVAVAVAVGAGLAVVLHPRTLLGRGMLAVGRGVARTVVLDKLTRWAADGVLTRLSETMGSPTNGSASPS